MNRPLIQQRVKRLRQKLAIPGYLLVAWSLAGQWSRTEFVLRKAGEIAAWDSFGWLLFFAGIGWLGWLIVRPAPTSGADRLERMKVLLKEAAEEYRMKTRSTNLDELAEESRYYISLLFFLRDGFQYWVREDYLNFINSERDKWDSGKNKFHYSLVTPKWLDDLADRITERDLDSGFHLPDHYAQYRETNVWQPNKRPL